LGYGIQSAPKCVHLMPEHLADSMAALDVAIPLDLDSCPGSPRPRRRKPIRRKRFGVGAWRSLVAHLLGVQVVGGSNPLAPTKLNRNDDGFEASAPGSLHDGAKQLRGETAR